VKGIRQCAVWAGPEKLELIQTKIPEVTSGTMLLKVHSCAICGSDLRIYKDGNPRITAPQIIGHEIAGEVVAVGKEINNFKVGDRVAVGADVPCNECIYCKSNMPNCCDINYAIGYQLEGGFSEFMLLDPLAVKYGPIQRFGSHISYDSAALAEPLACCINGYERGLMQSDRSVVIFGAGPIGIMLAMLAPMFRASQVIIIDPNESRLQRVEALQLASHFINPEKTNLTEVIFDLTNGLGADMIFTACPIVETHEKAVEVVSKRGVINFFGGLPKTASPITLNSNQLHYREAYITGSHGSTPKQHKRALHLIESKEVNVEPLITHRYNLKDIKEAFQKAFSGEALKVMVNPHV